MSALMDQARQQFNRGDLQIALATLGRLMIKERRNADAFILAATIHEKLGDRVAAAGLFTGAIDLTAKLRREVAFRAASHYVAVNDNAAALSALQTLYRHLPDDVDVNHSICSLYREAGRYDEALPFARTLLSIGRTFGNFLNAGIVLSGLGRYEEAYPVLNRAHQEKPQERLALSELFWCAANLCDFTTADGLQRELEEAYAREGDAADIRENAFRAITWSGDEAYHALCARRTAATLFPPAAPARPPRVRAAGERLRIGYLSCDFFDHATMALFAGVLEAHDRNRVEIFGICHTAAGNRKGPMRERFLDSVEHVVDILDLDDDAAAETIAALDLDVLVDLKGFTQGNRLGIFSRRPAPVQVTYLGFPGSVAGVGIDYVLTDAVVTPPASQSHYAEKLLTLSPSYQCNDAARQPVQRQGSRADHGLPEGAVVFCSFNQAQKIRGPVFAAWMDILAQVDGSVLWLADQPAMAKVNLKAAAEAAGIAPDRLVFAPKLPMTDHLQRLCQADIGLDTGPYNGHTTTSDALWCGVPVVSFKGSSFAGRVSESLLTAVGLPELVAQDLSEFGRLAVDLAQDGVRQSLLRQHLIQARESAPLFDTVALTRQIEAALERICS